MKYKIGSNKEFKEMSEVVDEGDILQDAPKEEYRSHTGGIYKIVKQDSRPNIFASCSVDATIKIWQAGNVRKNPLQSLEGHFGYVTDIQWIPNADMLGI